MRYVLLLALLPFPAAAWDFSPEPVCTLSHSQNGSDIVVTFDASLPEYAVSITTADFIWPDGIFFMAFSGPAPNTISTDLQTVSNGGTTLTVRDSGFGNVLNGLEFNQTATAGVDQSKVLFALDGIGQPMQDFRACPSVIAPAS